METYLFCVGIVLAGSVWVRYLAASEASTVLSAPGESPQWEVRRQT